MSVHVFGKRVTPGDFPESSDVERDKRTRLDKPLHLTQLKGFNSTRVFENGPVHFLALTK